MAYPGYPPLVAGAVSYTGSLISIPVQTLTKPPEGPRIIPLSITGAANDLVRVDIPQFNSNTQVGLSQIGTIIVDTMNLDILIQAASDPSEVGYIYIPDSKEYYTIKYGVIQTIPIHTAGLTFYAGFNAGVNATLSFQVLNFFQPPGVVEANAINYCDIRYLNGVKITGATPRLPVDVQVFSAGALAQNITQIGGSSANIANGRLPVDLQTQTLAALTIKQAAFTSNNSAFFIAPATGIGTQRIFNGSGVLRFVEINFDSIIAGAAGAGVQFGLLFDGAGATLARDLKFGNNETVLRGEVINLSNLAIAFNTSIDLNCNVFAGAITAANTDVVVNFGIGP